MRPTFASKARAAEMNAAKARKLNRESSEEGSLTVPSASPMSLGAFTKFKPASRNRGNKIWKPLDLSDVYEDTPVSAPSEPQEQVNEQNFAYDSIRTRLPSPLQPQNGTIPSTTFIDGDSAGRDQRLAYAEPELDDQEWDPDLPPIQDHDEELLQTETSSSSVAADVSANRTPSIFLSNPVAPKSILPTPNQAQQAHDSAHSPYLDIQASRQVTSEGLIHNAPRVNLPKQAEQEAKLASLGVGPAAPTHDHGKHLYPSHYPSPFSTHTEDPFVDNGGYSMHNFNSVRATPFDYTAEYSRRKGTMDRDFRFPAPGLYQPVTAAQHQLYGMPFGTDEPASHLQPYSMAYDGRSQTHVGHVPSQTTPVPVIGNNQNQGVRSAKREQLLISLNNIAEASKARGQSRTVLYDPVSSQGHHPTDSTQTEPFPSIVAEQHPPVVEGSKLAGLLALSEELPWKDRPVEIHTEVMPSLSDTELAAHGRALEMGTTPNQYAVTTGNTPASKYSAYSAERIKAADKWFRTDNRGGAEMLAYLDQVSNDELAKNHSARYGLSSHRPVTPEVSTSATSSNPVTHTTAGEVANALLAPLFVTLQSYMTEPPESQPRQFGRFGVVPEWCIDRSAEGSKSFFGENWGAPPPRVGRDPRYRPIMHEPRYTVYEEGPGAVGDGFVRRRW